jgi:hypothetical protein
MTLDIAPLPSGSRVLHIGPPKTGTTSLQHALFEQQAELAARGVAYPSRRPHERRAATWVSFPTPPSGYTAQDAQAWKSLARRAARSGADRVVLSSEMFSAAGPEQIDRIADDIGGDLQVVLTMRPLAALLPSRWQQSVQDGLRMPYSEWIDEVLRFRGDSIDHPIWRRYQLDDVIRRWGRRVGEANVTLVVLDPSDRGMLTAAFERLLALPPGILRTAAVLENLSLPYPEAELMRAFMNRYFADEAADPEFLLQAVRRRARKQIMAVSSRFPRSPIGVPSWALDASNQRTRAMLDVIGSTATHVVGDPQHLLVDPPQETADAPAPTTVSVDSAAEIAYAMLVGARSAARPKPSAGALPDLERATTSQLLGELRNRLRHPSRSRAE